MIYKLMVYNLIIEHWKTSKRKKKAIFALMMLRKRMQIRTRNYLTTAALLSPHQSEWHQLYNFGSDSELINAISLSRAGFQHLLPGFQRYYKNKGKVNGNGRPNKFTDPSTVLGLLLTYYCDSVGIKTLCRMFGAPRSTISRVLRRAEGVLFRCLKKEPLAAFSWPTKQQQVEWGRLVQAKEPLVKGPR